MALREYLIFPSLNFFIWRFLYLKIFLREILTIEVKCLQKNEVSTNGVVVIITINITIITISKQSYLTLTCLLLSIVMEQINFNFHKTTMTLENTIKTYTQKRKKGRRKHRNISRVSNHFCDTTLSSADMLMCIHSYSGMHVIIYI